ncbi:hypothetical protein SCUCBS95973_009243 [Sporothrix curviconia]|uniref:L-asparaginase n=1 Tax=Sporothrix curviconia TaxID=1260050 RepID=A0ABP0CTJ1_9PEZI
MASGVFDKADLQPRALHIQPRLIIHGGAGNISRATLTPERRAAYRAALYEIVTRTNEYMTAGDRPSALATAAFAVGLLEDCPLFNSGHGAVFTRDGINELEASVMVSRGQAKRGVGVMGLRRVRNPVRLARQMLEHGDADLGATGSQPREGTSMDRERREDTDKSEGPPNVDAGAQGHTQIYGAAAEALAAQYGLPLVDPSYFFTQTRWDEHVRALEREKQDRSASSTWSADEYLPQGTCGAVALDTDGVVCCATSTGGLTNKVTGRVGDTPVVGAGFWAGTWAEDGDPTAVMAAASSPLNGTPSPRPVVELSRALYRLLADCLPVPSPMPYVYSPLPSTPSTGATTTKTTRSVGLSGTGNGDSFLRVSAAHTVAAMAQYKPLSSAAALGAVAGPGGVLETSAGTRWGRTGEGEGGLIGIELAVVRDGDAVRQVRTAVIQDYNCGGMFRAWVDDAGLTQVRVFRDE